MFLLNYRFIYYPKAIARAVGSSVENPCADIRVTTLDKAAFLFVPPAPSSTTIKSDVVKSAPISVPPSISIAAKGKVPVSPVPTKVPAAAGKTIVADVPTEWACAFNI